ncbi:MAG TPA: ferritin family protein [bacterium]|jgi:rubrerythrin
MSETKKRTEQLLEIIDGAISLERNAKHFYRGMSEEIFDPDAKEMLFMMSDFEEGHELELFRKRLELLTELGLADENLPRVSIDREQSEVKLHPMSAPGELTVEGILLFGIEIEKRAKKYYEDKLAEVTDPDIRKLLLDLIREEEGHARILTRQLEGIDVSGFIKDMQDLEDEISH